MSWYDDRRISKTDKENKYLMTFLANGGNFTCPFIDYYPIPNLNIKTQLEPVIFCLCVWGESRGEIDDGQKAVASVIINRVLYKNAWKDNIRDVILQPKQFSCFNNMDVNKDKLIKPEVVSYYKVCKNVLPLYYAWELRTLNTATHYFNPRIRIPKWSKSLQYVTTIDKHKFYTIAKNQQSKTV